MRTVLDQALFNSEHMPFYQSAVNSLTGVCVWLRKLLFLLLLLHFSYCSYQSGDDKAVVRTYPKQLFTSLQELKGFVFWPCTFLTEKEIFNSDFLSFVCVEASAEQALLVQQSLAALFSIFLSKSNVSSF